MKKPNKPVSGARRGLREQDPHLEREAERYEHPLPSREFILQVLEKEGVPVMEDDLCAMLAIRRSERDSFGARLGAMERDGQVMRNRRGAVCLVEKLALIKGRVQAHPDGFGFLVRDDKAADMFVPPGEMQKVLHGDRVVVREAGVDRRGRPEAKIVEILERGNTTVVGRLHRERGVVFVVPEDKRLAQDFVVPPGDDLKAKAGQVVVAEIVQQPSRHVQPIARVTEVLGNYADPGMEIEIALRKHELPHVFPREVEAASRHFGAVPTDADMRGREDVRNLPLVTIDGETAKDFDDAVWCARDGRGWRLVVAIADVSHYVPHGGPLDREALARGNSVYFPRRVIPMLPEVLSNGLCSLNPQVDRLCMVCDMAIDSSGDIVKYRFYPAVMRSHARLTYNLVWDALQHPRGEAAKKHAALVPHLEEFYRLYKVLAKARLKRGAIDFETVETEMIFDAHGKIERIVPVKRNDAHRIIEECMLAANVSASDFLARHSHPALYRVHEGPTPEKLEALREFLKGFGLSLSGGDDPHARDYAKLLDKVRDRPDAQLLQTVMLRSLKQAVYSPENVGHFGLAYEAYTHFTSPIRRYPDLLVHRAIKSVLGRQAYRPGKWDELGLHCSMTERRADEATRDVVSWLKCFYMQDHVGESFTGTVSGVAAFGIFVALDDIYIEGLVHVSDLGNDYYRYDAAKHHLLGERSGRRFRLSDRVRVKVVRANLDTSRIDFTLEEEKRR